MKISIFLLVVFEDIYDAERIRSFEHDSLDWSKAIFQCMDWSVIFLIENGLFRRGLSFDFGASKPHALVSFRSCLSADFKIKSSQRNFSSKKYENM